MTEKALQAAVTELAEWLGWRTYHVFDSRRSNPGWPDLFMVRRDRAVAIELKSAKGVATKAQLEWLLALELAGVESHLWRPDDWLSGEIERTLR